LDERLNAKGSGAEKTGRLVSTGALSEPRVHAQYVVGGCGVHGERLRDTVKQCDMG
jgi:hypothetical protein